MSHSCCVATAFIFWPWVVKRTKDKNLESKDGKAQGPVFISRNKIMH